VQPISFLHFLRTKEAKLHCEMGKTIRQNMTLENKLVITNLLLTESCCRVLKSACNFLWGLHLLKTSVFVTKTPLTTLKSLLKPMMHEGEKAVDTVFSFLLHPYEPKLEALSSKFMEKSVFRETTVNFKNG